MVLRESRSQCFAEKVETMYRMLMIPQNNIINVELVGKIVVAIGSR